MRPNFLVIGAARSGSTSLFHYLGAHPDVFMARGKEVHFFDLEYDRGWPWYESRFAAEGFKAVGEASPSYIYDPIAIERIARHLPDVRLVAVLRNPVDRAYSQYWLNRARQREPLPFDAAIEAEAARLASADKRTRFFYSYVDQGWYLQQLQRVCTRFPEQQLHVVLLDDLEADAVGSFRRLAAFLGIDAGTVPSVVGKRVNEHRTFRSVRVRYATRSLPKPLRDAVGRINSRPVAYPPMSPSVRVSLTQRFAGANEALGEWLGRDLSSWNAAVDDPLEPSAPSER